MVRRPGAARRLASVCVLFLAAVLTTSCSGSDLAAVRGKVLYKGSPIEGAVVTFHPKGADDFKAQRPSGLTDKDGVFTLSTGSTPGAPAGDYVVTVNWHKPTDPPGGKKVMMSTEPPPPPPDQFQNKKYANRDQSPLTAKVAPGKTELEPFNLD